MDEPLLVLLDFFQAFPSVAHDFVRCAIAATSPPKGVQRSLDRLTAAIRITLHVHLETGISIVVETGVAQGCPLSGQVCVIAICMSLAGACDRTVACVVLPTTLQPLRRGRASSSAAWARCFGACARLVASTSRSPQSDSYLSPSSQSDPGRGAAPSG